jgi:hypothetical protein
MSQRELDRAISAIRNDQPEEKVLRDAAGRVFSRLFDNAFLHDSVERIRGCFDFQALMPAYLNGALTPARALLLRDHTLECVACRRVLQQGPELQAAVLPSTKVAAKPRKAYLVVGWAVAATLAVGIGLGVIGARYGLLPGQHAVRATVMSVEGSLYRISSIGSTLVKVGAVIANADELRTASGSRAVLQLIGGGRLEVAERSDLSVSRDWQGTTVNLEQGRLIVDAVDPQLGKLYVASGGMLVPVKGAVVSLDRGTKGSRVAVARGLARVQQGQNTFQLTAGQQMATNGLANVPIASEFAWSEHADSYLALLGELSTLQKQFQNIPSPGLRYSSNLAKYVPENSVIYAAVPNLGGTLAEAKRMFDDRLAESEVLRNWWSQQPASRSGDFDRLIAEVSSISQYLGNEIVFSLAFDQSQNHQQPLLLAEIRQSGLADYLRQNMPSSAKLQIVTDPSLLPAAETGNLFVSVSNNVLAASTDPVQLKRVAQLIQNGASGQFAQTSFYARIAKAYTAGAGYLLAVDLEQIVPKSVKASREHALPGLNNAQYLLLERRDATGTTDTRASLSFDGTRQGIASWLGAPGAMGSLDFVSPDAVFADAFIMKSPRSVVEELLAFATQNDPGFAQHLQTFEADAGVSILDDVAAPFGNDATFAIDGSLVPVPAWKLVVEVNDPSRLQQTLTRFVNLFNQQSAGSLGKLQAGSEQIDARTFYWLRSDKTPSVEAYYTFVDGYLIAGPSEANLAQAIQNRQTGYTLVSSPNFRNQLPADGYTNFSAIVYTNPGTALGTLAQQVKSSGSLTPAQQQSISALLTNVSPGLICLYGESDRIVAASRGSFLGFNLGTLAGIAQGQPLLPLLASSAKSSLAKNVQQRR